MLNSTHPIVRHFENKGETVNMLSFWNGILFLYIFCK